MGRVLLPQPTRGLWSVVSFSSAVRGGAPAENYFSDRMSLVVMSVMLLNKPENVRYDLGEILARFEGLSPLAHS